MSTDNISALVERAYRGLLDDADEIETIDRYIRGDQDDPYIPDSANTSEYKTLLKRCKTNFCGILTAAPAQAMYVDAFKRATDKSIASSGGEAEAVSSDMAHWQRSGLDARQIAVHRAAIGFGLAYTLTFRNPKDGLSYTKPLSVKRTFLLFDDPAFDVDPLGALYVVRHPKGDDKGKAFWYDTRFVHEVALGLDGEHRVVSSTPHGMSQCPVVRHAPWLDTEGRAAGLVRPLIAPQDRLNQTIFDLLIGQSYTAHIVRTITGMKVPYKQKVDPETGELVYEIDENGYPIPEPVKVSAARVMWAEDADTKFGTLPQADLSGFLSSAEATLKHMSALSNVPPHFLLGQVSNVSAEALQAAQTALLRMVDEVKASVGESWERVFRLAAELDGNPVGDTMAEVVWRDVGNVNIAQAADAIGKYKDVEVPKYGLWEMIPNVSQEQLARWMDWDKEADADAQLLERQFGSPLAKRVDAGAPPQPAVQLNPPPEPGQRI